MNNTPKNRAIGLIVLLVAVAGIAFWIYKTNQDDTSTTNPNLSVSVLNQTQNTDGTQVNAHPKDVLVYTLTAENPTEDVIEGFIMEVGIGDLTNNATLIDAQGANFNSGNNSLMWSPLDIPANGSIQKQFTVRVKETLPANAADRVVKVSYSNEVATNLAESVAVNPTPSSRPGQIGDGAYHAPQTGIPGVVSFYLALFITFGVMLFRIAYKIGSPRGN